MKTSEIIKFEKQLLEYLPSLSFAGAMMFLPPVEFVLRGISFEGSSFDKTSFYANTFLMPLCVPSNHLYYNFGSRVRQMGGEDRWTTAMPNLAEKLATALKLQALPFLTSVTTLLDFVEMARSFSPNNPNTLRAIAYSLARSGRAIEAIEVLGKLLDQLDPMVPWQLDLANEAEKLRGQLVSRPTDAMRQLQIWEAETARNLGLARGVD